MLSLSISLTLSTCRATNFVRRVASISLRTISACLPTMAISQTFHSAMKSLRKKKKTNSRSERHLQHQKEMLRSQAYTILRNGTRRNQARYNKNKGTQTYFVIFHKDFGVIHKKNFYSFRKVVI